MSEIQKPVQETHYTIEDFDTIVSSKISLEMESLKIYKESLISLEIDTFDRLRSDLNSFHGELLWAHVKIEVCTLFVTLYFRKIAVYW